MTPEEAIQYLECGAVPGCCCASNKRHGGDCGGEDKVNEAINIAIQALEKQVPKKPTQLNGKIRYCEMFKCPSCGCEFSGRVSKFCFRCGQKLDWSEENDKN